MPCSDLRAGAPRALENALPGRSRGSPFTFRSRTPVHVSSVDGDPGEGARRRRVRARPQTTRATRSSQDPNAGSDCGAGGPPSSTDRTRPPERADEMLHLHGSGRWPDLEDAREAASSRMIQEQNDAKARQRRAIFLESAGFTREFVAHFDPRGPKWPTAIDGSSCAQRGTLSDPGRARPVAAELARELTRVLRNGAPTGQPSARATQRARQIRAPSECSSTAENRATEPRTTDAWRTNAAHEPTGATGSADNPGRQPARHPSPRVLAERSSAAKRVLRRIPEDARRLPRIPPSFILLSRALSSGLLIPGSSSPAQATSTCAQRCEAARADARVSAREVFISVHGWRSRSSTSHVDGAPTNWSPRLHQALPSRPTSGP